MRLFGIEIEFAAPYGVREALNMDPRLSSYGFYCGTDGSANLGCLQGLEVRHANPVAWTDVSIHNLKETLTLIKSEKGVVHRCCGLHIHFSGFGEVDMESFTHSILTKFPKINWESRRKWCREDHPKYRVIRYIRDDHYECRVFNSTLNLRAILQYQKKLVQTLLGGNHANSSNLNLIKS